uniref:NADH dehydrogenase subunit 4 n=1 Tax=Trimerodytes annularis TaxID=2678873 RepID=UPI00202987A7|nr:NADH dehydrogenase subunit 4 [Trimerodytes annularis]UQT68000.1 NADH dehydrogenase subunit 4 [Trimerodytes annularis]
MLKIVYMTLMLIPTTLIIKPKMLYTTTTSYAFMLALISMTFMEPTSNTHLYLDHTSAPLFTLSYWLLPMTMVASQNMLKKEPLQRQRTMLTALIMLQFFIALTFTAYNLTLMYIMFEATLIPTLIIITRWGQQAERLTAGTYFMLYTLTTSMPLLMTILFLNNTSFTPTLFMQMTQTNQTTELLLWLGCLTAFLAKMPIYGLHLWLPKAHVEAPVAGSMVLAAVLLKLGGYGIIRMMQTLPMMKTDTFLPFIILAMWGATLANLTCLQQTDLKSLIAYSSISHMGLVIAAIMIQTQWSLSGAMALMIAHGFTSSALFCLANTSYERTNTRIMILTRGLHNILPMMTAWWLMTNLMNIATPPSMNFTGELMIAASLFNWCPTTIIMFGLSMLITASYSLHMFLSTQMNTPMPNTPIQPTHSREHLLMFLHTAPLMLISLKPELVM